MRVGGSGFSVRGLGQDSNFRRSGGWESFVISNEHSCRILRMGALKLQLIHQKCMTLANYSSTIPKV